MTKLRFSAFPNFFNFPVYVTEKSRKYGYSKKKGIIACEVKCKKESYVPLISPQIKKLINQQGCTHLRFYRVDVLLYGFLFRISYCSPSFVTKFSSFFTRFLFYHKQHETSKVFCLSYFVKFFLVSHNKLLNLP